MQLLIVRIQRCVASLIQNKMCTPVAHLLEIPIIKLKLQQQVIQFTAIPRNEKQTSCVGYILPPLGKHLSQCFKIQTYHENQTIKLTITQMHTHFSQLYIAGNFPCLTDVVRISGIEWVPTDPTHHLNPFPLNRPYTKLAKQQTVQIYLSNLTCSFCFQHKSLHMLCHFMSESTIPDQMQCFQLPNVLHYYILL